MPLSPLLQHQIIDVVYREPEYAPQVGHVKKQCYRAQMCCTSLAHTLHLSWTLSDSLFSAITVSVVLKEDMQNPAEVWKAGVCQAGT